MNFIQGLLHPRNMNNKNNQKATENFSQDYSRLLQLCNSYGLDQKQTSQLIQQFKKGHYNSANNSVLDDSEISVDDSFIQSRNKYHEGLNHLNNQESKSQQFQLQNERKYQKVNQIMLKNENKNKNQHNQQSYTQNQSQQQNNTSYNQMMTFNDRQEQSGMDSHLRSSNQQYMIHNQCQKFNFNQYEEQSFNQNFVKKGKLVNNNYKNKIQLQNKEQNKNNQQKQQKKIQMKKNTHPKGQKQLQRQQIKELIRRKSQQLRSIEQFQRQQQEQKYQLQQERQNYMLQRINQLQLQNRQNQIKYSELSKENQFLLKQNQFFKQKLKETENKVNIFIKMKESDTAIILGLKDTITNLTRLLQQKQGFCQDLQNKLNQFNIQALNNHQKQNTNSTYFQRNSKNKQKKLDRKQSSPKNIQNQPEAFKESKSDINQNQRKELSDLTNMNLNLNQQNRNLIRQNSMKKLNNVKDKESVKRTSSRIDIKKYKGMIQQLRNNYPQH